MRVVTATGHVLQTRFWVQAINWHGGEGGGAERDTKETKHVYLPSSVVVFLSCLLTVYSTLLSLSSLLSLFFFLFSGRPHLQPDNHQTELPDPSQVNLQS